MTVLTPVLEHLSASLSAGTHPWSSAAHELVPPSLQSKCWPGPGGAASAPPAKSILAKTTAVLGAQIDMTSPFRRPTMRSRSVSLLHHRTLGDVKTRSSYGGPSRRRSLH